MIVGAIAVPAGGAVAIGALLSVGLTALACSLVLFGLLKGYQWTLGALLTGIADKVRGVRWIGGTLADALDSIDEWVVDKIGQGVLASERQAARFFHGIAWIWEATVDATVTLAQSTADALSGLTGSEIPRQITERTAELQGTVAKQGTWAKARDRAIARQVSTGIDRLQRDLAAEKLARERGIDAIDARIAARVDGIADTLGGSIAGVRSWAGERFRSVDARIGTALTAVGAAAGTAAVLRVLDRSFPYYKCRNVKRFNRALCGGSPDLLMSLMALSALTAVAVDPRAVARAGQEATELLAELLAELADV